MTLLLDKETFYQKNVVTGDREKILPISFMTQTDFMDSYSIMSQTLRGFWGVS